MAGRRLLLISSSYPPLLFTVRICFLLLLVITQVSATHSNDYDVAVDQTSDDESQSWSSNGDNNGNIGINWLWHTPPHPWLRPFLPRPHPHPYPRLPPFLPRGPVPHFPRFPSPKTPPPADDQPPSIPSPSPTEAPSNPLPSPPEAPTTPYPPSPGAPRRDFGPAPSNPLPSSPPEAPATPYPPSPGAPGDDFGPCTGEVTSVSTSCSSSKPAAAGHRRWSFSYGTGCCKAVAAVSDGCSKVAFIPLVRYMCATMPYPPSPSEAPSNPPPTPPDQTPSSPPPSAPETTPPSSPEPPPGSDGDFGACTGAVTSVSTSCTSKPSYSWSFSFGPECCKAVAAVSDGCSYVAFIPFVKFICSNI